MPSPEYPLHMQFMSSCEPTDELTGSTNRLRLVEACTMPKRQLEPEEGLHTVAYAEKRRRWILVVAPRHEQTTRTRPVRSAGPKGLPVKGDLSVGPTQYSAETGAICLPFNSLMAEQCTCFTGCASRPTVTCRTVECKSLNVNLLPRPLPG
jgi:hypothetical protein